MQNCNIFLLLLNWKYTHFHQNCKFPQVCQLIYNYLTFTLRSLPSYLPSHSAYAAFVRFLFKWDKLSSELQNTNKSYLIEVERILALKLIKLLNWRNANEQNFCLNERWKLYNYKDIIEWHSKLFVRLWTSAVLMITLL